MWKFFRLRQNNLKLILLKRERFSTCCVYFRVWTFWGFVQEMGKPPVKMSSVFLHFRKNNWRERKKLQKIPNWKASSAYLTTLHFWCLFAKDLFVLRWIVWLGYFPDLEFPKFPKCTRERTESRFLWSNLLWI